MAATSISESIRVVDDLDDTAWREFVDIQPRATIFHTPEMAHLFAATPGHDVSVWAAQANSGAVLALLVPVCVTLSGGPLRPWTSRAIAYGGIAHGTDEIAVRAAGALLETYARRRTRDVLFTELRHQHDESKLFPRLHASGFVHERHLNYLVRLTGAEEDLWALLSRTARQRIRSAEKKGVVTTEALDDATIDAAYRLLVDVYDRARVPLASRTLFESARRELQPRGMLRVLTAHVDDRIVGARFLLTYKTRIIDWYAAADRAFASYSPSEHLVWHALRWGREHGFDVFDFGGAGRPDEPYGPREFKSKFGGELVDYGRDVLVHGPVRLRVSRSAYAVARRLRS
jgi:hypothetical protein